MKTYPRVLRDTVKEFSEDLVSVPLYATRAVLQLLGCCFILCFVFISPVFVPLYAYVQWKNQRLAQIERRLFLAKHDFIDDYNEGKFFGERKN